MNCANPECGHEDFMHPTTSRGNKFCHIDGCNCDAYVAPAEPSLDEVIAAVRAKHPKAYAGSMRVKVEDGLGGLQSKCRATVYSDFGSDYIAQAWLGTDPGNNTLVKAFDSTQYGHRPNDNAFDACRNFITENLDTYDFGKMKLLPHSDDSTAFDDLCFGAFTHPVRGRVKFNASCNNFKADLAEEQRLADIKVYSPAELYSLKPVSVAYTDLLPKLLENWLPSSYKRSWYFHHK